MSTLKQKKLFERNQRICKQILSGKHLTKVNKEFGLTYTRVQQILSEKFNISYQDILKERRQKLFQHRLKLITEKAKELGRIPTRREMSKIFGIVGSRHISYAKILKQKGYQYAKKGSSSNRIDDEALLQYLKDLSNRLGRTPGAKDINRGQKFSHLSYYNHFGSITKAQKLAGLKPNKRGYTSNIFKK
ncbi:MAG: hypothetical protein FVQ77_04205 [Cytophagales bacterium]|nr:hypothetical protein [Cytophagales bacterium]